MPTLHFYFHSNATQTKITRATATADSQILMGKVESTINTELVI